MGRYNILILVPKAFVLLKATLGICVGITFFFFFFSVTDSNKAIGKILLGQWSLKWVPRTSTSAITWELARNAESRAPLNQKF